MALKIRSTSPPPTPVKDYPDVDVWLEQNDDGSVDVVTGYAGDKSPDLDMDYSPSRVIRFFDDGSIARISDFGPGEFGVFHKFDENGRVVID